jgi:micrococcal nuclease
MSYIFIVALFISSAGLGMTIFLPEIFTRLGNGTQARKTSVFFFSMLFVSSVLGLMIGVPQDYVDEPVPASVPEVIEEPAESNGDVQQPDIPLSAPFAVTQVVDGDTIKAMVDGKETTFRLIGMDTPEVVDPRKPVQCFGKEASDKAKEMLEGKKVSLKMDISQGRSDKYGRTLAYVYLPDGTLFNKYMIEEGYAHEYTYADPYEFQDEFKAAEKEARENGRGLWSPDTCNGDTVRPA